MPHIIEANSGDIILMVGTRKGAFLLTADRTRRNWSVSGPHHAGSDVYHMAYDDREKGTVFVAINDPIWGPEIQRSQDLGATWLKAAQNPRFAEVRAAIPSIGYGTSSPVGPANRRSSMPG